jgi:fatty acid desaturase
LIILLVQGFNLGFFFTISHNFEDSKKSEFSNDWYKNQIESSSTYGGSMAWTLTGGLNYQIEHHLFPRMSHVHYPRI